MFGCSRSKQHKTQNPKQKQKQKPSQNSLINKQGIKKQEMIGDSNPLKPLSLFKQHSFVVKLVVLSLLLGLTIRLLSSHSFDYSSSVWQTETATDSPVFDSPESDSLKGSVASNSAKLIKDEAKQKCDLFKGEWIPNPTGPVYNNNTCPFMETPQNCLTNGRPDSAYLYWRWKPLDCNLARFNPERFLDLMRNKYWAFIGDSISRNHVQSLLCTLSQVELPKQIYHDEEYKSRTWVFPSYNFTLAVIWSPYLVKAKIFEDNNGFSTSETQIHLDKLDEKWTVRYKDFDYVIIAGGKWFLKTAVYYENNTVQGCHYCHGVRNLTELGIDYAYSKALQVALNFVTSPSHKAQVFLRTITPDHFENGEWFSGGTCNRVVPFKEGEVNITDVDRVLRDVELQEFDKAAAVALERGATLKLFDTTQLSLLRPDGHPGPYRQFHPFAEDKNAKVQYDCLHWCLPGPIDSWNDLVMEILMNN